MSPDEKIGRRIIGSFVLGVCIALVNFGLDVSFAHLRTVPPFTVLNDLLIGTAASLTYIWASRQDTKHALELSNEKVVQEAVHDESANSP